MIDEIPPDEKPDGDNVQWIPGYWAWDDQQNDYLWVSGFWRQPPPGRHWVGGNWQESDKGWQWVAGVWMDSAAQQVQYLPPPPETIDEGPSTPAPDAASTYVPGSWIYVNTGYYWQPGHWVRNHPNWVWTPAYYSYTPSGYLYTTGYWDHPLDERGLLFAPVRFGRDWQGGSYSPGFVVSSDFLLGALFVRTANQHYYFGDYFENRYASLGYTAWPDYRYGRAGYDPNYNYYRQTYSGNAGWEPGIRELYRARAAGDISRPPTTYNQQLLAVSGLGSRSGSSVGRNLNLTQSQNIAALVPLKQVSTQRISNLASLRGTGATPAADRAMTLKAVPKDEIVREQRQAAALRETAVSRQKEELQLFRKGGTPMTHTDAPKPAAWAAARNNTAVATPEPKKTDAPPTNPAATPKPATQPATPQPAAPAPKPAPQPATPQPATPAPAPKPAPQPAAPQPATPAPTTKPSPQPAAPQPAAPVPHVAPAAPPPVKAIPPQPVMPPHIERPIPAAPHPATPPAAQPPKKG